MGALPDTLATRSIGRIPLAPTLFGLGCWVFGGHHWGGADDADSLATLHAAFEAGVNHFDTAACYGDGHSEELLGAFARPRREQVFLASKAMLERPTARATQRAIDDSLLRLQTDYIDLYYLHWPIRGYDPRFAQEGLARALEAGKIRGIGLSNCTAAQINLVREIAPVDAVQACYNALWRPAERELLPACLEWRIPVFANCVLAQGILTGKFDLVPQFRKGDLRAKTVHFEPEVWPVVHATVARMLGVARDVHRPLAQLAIGWALAQRGVAGVLVGARDRAQLHTNLGALVDELPADALHALTDLSNQLLPELPDVPNIWRYEP